VNRHHNDQHCRPLYTSNAPPSRYALAAGRLPRRAIPLFATAEGAPAGCPAVICFPSAYRFIKLSRDQAPDGRQHRFRSGHAALSTPLQSSVRFFHPPARAPQQLPSRVACPVAEAGIRGLPCSAQVPSQLRSHPYAGGATSAMVYVRPTIPGHLPFGPSHQHLGLVLDDGAAVIHLS
jgi:hypothetical protein